MATIRVESVKVDVTLAENAAAHTYISDKLGYSESRVVVDDDWSEFRPDQINRLAP